VYVQVKTTQADALMFYGGGNEDGDFLSVELSSGRVRYVFDVGSGVRVLADRRGAPPPLNDNAWHSVSVERPTVRRQRLVVDGRASVDELPDSRSVHFDLPGGDALHVGGLAPAHRYGRRGSRRRRPAGFQGCLASIALNGEDWRLSESRAVIDDAFVDDIVQGCEGFELHQRLVRCLHRFFFASTLCLPKLYRNVLRITHTHTCLTALFPGLPG